jgi:hypothetical protein
MATYIIHYNGERLAEAETRFLTQIIDLMSETWFLTKKVSLLQENLGFYCLSLDLMFQILVFHENLGFDERN